jgi:hypothetical protein
MVMMQELRAQEEYEVFYRKFVTGDLVDVAGDLSPLSCLVVRGNRTNPNFQNLMCQQ